MKLQVAIDRVTLDQAVEIAGQLDGIVPIIEMGTSLIKDYGIIGIQKIRNSVSQSELLIDTKTIDEGQHEFEQGYRYGGDILTVMAASSKATLDTTYQVAERENKQMMIDLLEVNHDKIEGIAGYANAIYALHHSVDRSDKFNVTDAVEQFKKQFTTINHIAVAGGINLKSAKQLSEQGIVDIVIVGSGIVKADNIVKAAQKFMEVM